MISYVVPVLHTHFLVPRTVPGTQRQLILLNEYAMNLKQENDS